MKKKLYERPEVRAVEIRQEQCILLQASVNGDWQKGWNELDQ